MASPQSSKSNRSTKTAESPAASDQPFEQSSAAWQASWQIWADTARAAASQHCDDTATLVSNSFEKANTKMTNSFSDATSMGRDMTQATMQYCQTWSKGCEEISRSTMSLCQSLAQDCMSAFKSLLTARTLQDAMTMQGDFMRQQYEKLVTESTRLGEVYTRTATEAAEPVKTQMQNLGQTINQTISQTASKFTPSYQQNQTSRAA